MEVNRMIQEAEEYTDIDRERKERVGSALALMSYLNSGTPT